MPITIDGESMDSFMLSKCPAAQRARIAVAKLPNDRVYSTREIVKKLGISPETLRRKKIAGLARMQYGYTMLWGTSKAIAALNKEIKRKEEA